MKKPSSTDQSQSSWPQCWAIEPQNIQMNLALSERRGRLQLRDSNFKVEPLTELLFQTWLLATLELRALILIPCQMQKKQQVHWLRHARLYPNSNLMNNAKSVMIAFQITRGRIFKNKTGHWWIRGVAVLCFRSNFFAIFLLEQRKNSDRWPHVPMISAFNFRGNFIFSLGVVSGPAR